MLSDCRNVMSVNVPYGNRPNRQQSKKGQPPPVKQKPVGRSASLHKAKAAIFLEFC